MNRKQLLTVIVMGIIYATYAAVIFLLTKDMSKNFWLSFAFVTASFLFMVISHVLVSKPEIHEQVVGLPITVLSSLYAFVELVMGTVFMYVRVSFVAAFIPQLVLFALFLCVYLPAMFGNNYKKPEEHKEN